MDYKHTHTQHEIRLQNMNYRYGTLVQTRMTSHNHSAFVVMGVNDITHFTVMRLKMNDKFHLHTVNPLKFTVHLFGEFHDSSF